MKARDSGRSVDEVRQTCHATPTATYGNKRYRWGQQVWTLLHPTIITLDSEIETGSDAGTIRGRELIYLRRPSHPVYGYAAAGLQLVARCDECGGYRVGWLRGTKIAMNRDLQDELAFHGIEWDAGAGRMVQWLEDRQRVA